MKIPEKNLSYEKVMALPKFTVKEPIRQSWFLRKAIKMLGASDLKATSFTYTTKNMEGLKPNEPCLYLMNHSSFIDLKIAATLIDPKPFSIVCTSDGFVGKEGLMRHLGCIPAWKFTTDMALVRDMQTVVRRLKQSVLMYPEASYSFDGTETPLPDSIGKLIRMLGVPVVMIRTKGAFLRDPLYNNLQLRNTPVSAHMECILTKEETKSKTPDEINVLLTEWFHYDHFKEQAERGVKVTEPFRADGLERALYKCPHCGAEGHMRGAGITLTCHSCGKTWELTEEGRMQSTSDSVTEFPHIPDWYAWERRSVREELEAGTYNQTLPVTVRMMVDTKSIYRVGSGTLIHTPEGFELNACDGQLSYHQSAKVSYSLYSDFFWYEIGDMICLGKPGCLYYCFPEGEGALVAKARLATEEAYKLAMGK